MIDGLRSLRLRPDVTPERERLWRWTGRHRGFVLVVDLLTPATTDAGRPRGPASGTVAESNIGPDGRITALPLAFGHLVPEDTQIVKRRVETQDGMIDYDFPVAGLTSWLALKADAIAHRDKPKDAYDVVWVLDAIGPAQAAAVVAGSAVVNSCRADVVGQLERMTGDQFRDVASAAPGAYARFVAGTDDTDMARQRRHAAETVRWFADGLRRQGVFKPPG